VFRHHIPQLVELIADTVLYPNLLPEELEAQKVNAAVGILLLFVALFLMRCCGNQYEFDSMDKQIDLVMGELVHVAAYHQNTLGLPLLCPDVHWNRLCTIKFCSCVNRISSAIRLFKR